MLDNMKDELAHIKRRDAKRFKKNIDILDLSCIRFVGCFPAEEDEPNRRTFKNKTQTIKILKDIIKNHKLVKECDL